MDKNEILNSDWEVRAKVAENPPRPPMCSQNWQRIATVLSAVMRQEIPTSPITKRKNFNLR